MKYLGSKDRHADEILAIVLEGRTDQVYVEPFVGGGNVIWRVSGVRIGCDINSKMIALFRAVAAGQELPDTISEEQYRSIRNNQDAYADWLVAFVAIACSYGGKWWGGYARGKTASGVPRDYLQETKKNLLSMAAGLQGVRWSSGSYWDLPIPDNSIIYCDPPYRGTTGYKDAFDSDAFFLWAGDQAAQGHRIFVSEYQAPKGWECVWEKAGVMSALRRRSGAASTERLFTLR